MLKIKKVNENAIIPKYQTKGSVGLDLHSVDDFTIMPNERAIIDTGIQMSIPNGYEVQIRPRSGLSAKHGIMLVNSPGTIDQDYRGNIKIIMLNTGSFNFPIKIGDRIAQMVIAPISKLEIKEVEELDDTERSAGGLGSTGI